MTRKEITREHIIQTLKELDADSKKTVGRKALQKKGINQYWIGKLIPEGLTALKKELGLKISSQEQPHSPDKLLEEIDRVTSKLKRMPTFNNLRHETGITDKVFVSNFGKKGIRGVYLYFREWLQKHKPESENIKLVDAYLKSHSKPRTPQAEQKTKYDKVQKITKYQKGSGRTYGSVLNFRNLIHEPTNEQGVVFLFGMLSEELGFSIDWIGTDFPDCVAKRYIHGPRNLQQRVKIEFEFMSRNYDHPVDSCDIIVCWEDNWGEDCPLEVIELRKVIEKMRNK